MTWTLAVATWVVQVLYVQSTEWVAKFNKLDFWEDMESLSKEQYTIFYPKSPMDGFLQGKCQQRLDLQYIQGGFLRLV